MDLLLQNKQRKELFNRIKLLESELLVSKDNEKYYKELLTESRKMMLEIKNKLGAKSCVADSETIDEAWIRNFNEIIRFINA